MKQTGTEFLFEQVVNLDWKNLQGEEKMKIFEKAKEMEKQQIIDAYEDGYSDSDNNIKLNEQYYTEIFKNK